MSNKQTEFEILNKTLETETTKITESEKPISSSSSEAINTISNESENPNINVATIECPKEDASIKSAKANEDLAAKSMNLEGGNQGDYAQTKGKIIENEKSSEQSQTKEDDSTKKAETKKDEEINIQW